MESYRTEIIDDNEYILLPIKHWRVGDVVYFGNNGVVTNDIVTVVKIDEYCVVAGILGYEVVFDTGEILLHLPDMPEWVLN